MVGYLAYYIWGLVLHKLQPQVEKYSLHNSTYA